MGEKDPASALRGAGAREGSRSGEGHGGKEGMCGTATNEGMLRGGLHAVRLVRDSCRRRRLLIDVMSLDDPAGSGSVCVSCRPTRTSCHVLLERETPIRSEAK